MISYNKFFKLITVFVLIQFVPVKPQCLLDHFYVIRHQVTGLVLEASDKQIVPAYFTGYPVQSWRFECAGEPSLLATTNEFTATWMDGNRDNIILDIRDLQSKSQQWILNSDGSILNVATQNCLSLTNDNTMIQLAACNNSSDQRFTLQMR